MSYVCLWSPSWPTGVDFGADLVQSLLAHAPRITVGERGLVWADARGLNPAPLAEQLLAVATAYGFDDARASAAMTPVAAEVGACGANGANGARLVIVKPGNDRQYISRFPLSVLSRDEQ